LSTSSVDGLCDHASVTRADGSLKLGSRLLLLVPIVIGLVVATMPLVDGGDPTTLIFYASYASIGALLAIRRPGNVVGWILVALSLGFIGTSPPSDVDVAALQAGRASARDAIVVWISVWAGNAVLVLFATLAIVFPSGRLPAAGRARRISVAVLLVGFVGILVALLAPGATVYSSAFPDGVDVPNPFGVVPASEAAFTVQVVNALVLVLLIAVAVTMLLVRYRREAGVAKLQLRWVLAAIALIVFAIVFGLVLTSVAPDLGGLPWVPAIVAYPTLPLAIGVAVFRYRLYEIDRIVNRAIVYGSVTAILAGVLAAASALSQRVLSEIAGGTSEFAIVAITLLVATLYTPLRKRVERVVDVYFKYDQRTFGAYREELHRMAELVDPNRAARRLADEALAETRATGVAVTDPSGTVLASAGKWPVEVVARVLLSGSSPVIGVILVGDRVDGRRHAPQVLTALAEVASLVDLSARVGIPAPAATVEISLVDRPEQVASGGMEQALSAD
jgi:hypothetical protein